LVKSGETLSRIARRYDTTIEAITAANDLRNANLIYPGQRLTITEGAPVLSRAASLSVGDASYAPGHGKWIEVNLSHQTVIAWEGAKPIQRMLASLGLPYTPTPPGRFQILRKYASVPMSGPGYYLPGVPHTMFFYRGYAIHGAYWHNNFGQPMSHGCVNLSLPDAAWLYQWTPLGTPVIIHW
jgi:murein DD-endopeptidase MepM/ murein hydrolase activator NlpD